MIDKLCIRGNFWFHFRAVEGERGQGGLRPPAVYHLGMEDSAASRFCPQGIKQFLPIGSERDLELIEKEKVESRAEKRHSL